MFRKHAEPQPYARLYRMYPTLVFKESSEGPCIGPRVPEHGTLLSSIVFRIVSAVLSVSVSPHIACKRRADAGRYTIGTWHSHLSIYVLSLCMQIYNIVNAQSADGLSALSFELETYTMVIHTAYGYLNGMAFSSYGEALILALQNFIILALIYKFTKAGWSRAGSTFSFYGAIVTGIAAGGMQAQLHPLHTPPLSSQISPIKASWACQQCRGWRWESTWASD